MATIKRLDNEHILISECVIKGRCSTKLYISIIKLNTETLKQEIICDTVFGRLAEDVTEHTMNRAQEWIVSTMEELTTNSN